MRVAFFESFFCSSCWFVWAEQEKLASIALASRSWAKVATLAVLMEDASSFSCLKMPALPNDGSTFGQASGLWSPCRL